MTLGVSDNSNTGIHGETADARQDTFLLGHERMDQTHREFLALLNQLQRADKAQFSECFAEFVRHTQVHFEQEEQWMQECAFPARDEHAGEHRRVLRELQQFEQRVARGSQMMARAWINQQAQPWFELHLSTMDAALATHLCSQTKTTG